MFCQVDGTMLHPERFSRSFGDRVRQLGLPTIRLHDLRHGWATMALGGKVNARVVQERLGHANVGITLNVYSHVTDGMHDNAAETVADIVFGDR
ncbi:MAG: tyrosine-type recombinase/integrase [Nocardioidaceae bacterium]|nr:tyrosine-type recombinase/integrase [Nocardioidaceae bacterium]